MLRNVVCSLQRESALSSFGLRTCHDGTQVCFYWPGPSFTSWIQMVIVTNVGVWWCYTPGSTQASAQNEMHYHRLISRHSGTVEGAPKYGTCESKRGLNDNPVSKVKCEGGSRDSGLLCESQHTFDGLTEVRPWVITCQEWLSCRVLMWVWLLCNWITETFALCPGCKW